MGNYLYRSCFFFYNNDDHILQTNNWTLKQKKVYI